jgi:hypothetical protein
VNVLTSAHVVDLLIAVLVLATAIVSWLTRRKVNEVHVLVNGRLTDVLDRVEQLTEALEASDTPVPPERRSL